MHGPREMLNELKWTRGLDGVPSYFELPSRGGESASIPYHRVLRIERAGEVPWERRDRPP